MTYEWGYSAGPPMAVAPLDKVRQVVDYALREIEAKKLFFQILQQTKRSHFTGSRNNVIGRLSTIHIIVRIYNCIIALFSSQYLNRAICNYFIGIHI